MKYFVNLLVVYGSPKRDNEVGCICDVLGEDVVIPIDSMVESNQEYMVDCPVCCHLCVIYIHIGDG